MERRELEKGLGGKGLGIVRSEGAKCVVSV